MNLKHITFEWCPYCEYEVEIYSKGVQQCPSCSEEILPCSECVKQNCLKCPYGKNSDT